MQVALTSTPSVPVAKQRDTNGTNALTQAIAFDQEIKVIRPFITTFFVVTVIAASAACQTTARVAHIDETLQNAAFIEQIVRQTINELEFGQRIHASSGFPEQPASVEAEICDYSEPLSYSEPSGGWDAGGELVFLRPHFDLLANGAAIASAFDVGPPFVEQSEISVPEFDHETTFRVWLGWTHCCGLGARIRYWQFDHDASPAIAEAQLPNNSQRSTLETALDIEVLDLESTAYMTIGRWSLLGSSGLRYLRSTRDSRSNTVTDDGGTVTTASGTATVDYEGYGLTFSLEAQRCTPWRWRPYANVRTSVIAGDNFSFQQVGEFEANGTPIMISSATAESENGVLIIEWQTGLEYSRCFGCHELFFRAGLEAQYWINGGRALSGLSFDFLGGPTLSAGVPEGSVTFVGLGASGGLRW